MLGTKLNVQPFLERVGQELLRVNPAEVQALADAIYACYEQGLIRTLYPAHQMAKKYGIPFDIATSSDVPTQVWTLPTVLTGARTRPGRSPSLRFCSSRALSTLTATASRTRARAGARRA